MPTRTITILLVLLAALLGGCNSAPHARQTGFLSDYAQLEKTGPERMGYLAPELAGYHAFVLQDLEFLIPDGKLTDTDRAEIAAHLRARVVEVLQSRGFTVTDTAGPDAARIRLAITGIAESTWWMKIHPGARLTGAGTGGAAMEGEIVDAATGRQLAAAVVASPASQFDLTAFSTVADVKNTIDDWARQAGRRLDALLAATSPMAPGGATTPAPAANVEPIAPDR